MGKQLQQFEETDDNEDLKRFVYALSGLAVALGAMSLASPLDRYRKKILTREHMIQTADACLLQLFSTDELTEAYARFSAAGFSRDQTIPQTISQSEKQAIQKKYEDPHALLTAIRENIPQHTLTQFIHAPKESDALEHIAIPEKVKLRILANYLRLMHR
jgi:hypothetical protein